MKLRDYQEECIDILDKKGEGKWLVQMATGLGKTVTFSNLKRNGRMLILSHREELVYQPLKYFDCPTGVEKGDKKSNGEEVVSASVQSIVRRLNKFEKDEFEIVVVDEAHHSAAPTYKKILSYFKPRQIIGFTATPNRGDKVRLDDVFDEIVFQRDLRWAIQNKFLCDIDCKRVDIGYDISSVRTRQGDFAQDELAKQLEGTEYAIAEVYKNLAVGATLIFASSVRNAEAIANQIDGAVVVTAKTENREQIIKDFTDKKIPCLVNCMIFTEGTDLPLVETVIIAKPTQSDALYTQMVGRGLRLCEGKEKLRLIDCVGITGKRDICTAPTLLGIDISSLDKRSKDKVQGDLFSLPDVIDKLNDSPRAWIRNIEDVNIWSMEQGYDFKGVNYMRMPDGRFICPLPNDKGIIIPCPDVMGLVQSDRDGTKIPLQVAFNRVRIYLGAHHKDSKNIWDVKAQRKWAGDSASDKQINIIKSYGKDYLNDIDLANLTKIQAMQIIARLKYCKESKK